MDIAETDSAMRPQLLRLLPLLAAAPVLALLVLTMHSALTTHNATAGRKALSAHAAALPSQRSSVHLPYFSFVRALRLRS